MFLKYTIANRFLRLWYFQESSRYLYMSMMVTNLHINGFIQKRSRVPGWHLSDYLPARRSRKCTNMHCPSSNGLLTAELL